MFVEDDEASRMSNLRNPPPSSTVGKNRAVKEQAWIDTGSNEEVTGKIDALGSKQAELGSKQTEISNKQSELTKLV